jgi:hypothetical protein
MKINFIYTVLLICVISISCNDKKTKSNIDKKVVGKNILLKGWKEYNSDKIKINLPNYWNPISIDKALLYVPISDKFDIYFVVLRYTTKQIKSNDYIKKIFDEVSKKDLKFNYNLKKIYFKNTNTCYYLEFFTKEGNIEYKIYSVIYEFDNQIYDFSFKTLNDEKMNIKNYQTFFSVIFSFEYRYDNIIDAEKFIIDKEEVLKYENL